MNCRLVLITFLTALLFIIIPLGHEDTSGEQSDEPDDGGYLYTDSGQPEPTINVNYIDVKGDPNAIGWNTQSVNALTSVELPFDFKYYGKYYSTVHISQYGAFSFVEKTGTTYRNVWSYSIPSTNSPKGVIAVYWTSDDDCQSNDRDKLYTLETTIDGEEVFIIEWNTRRVNNKFQAVLHDGGLIDFQYSSITGPWGQPVGAESIIGIEKPDGSTGIEYNPMQWVSTDIFIPPFAITYHAGEVIIEKARLLNGDGPLGDIVYAGAKPYLFRATVFHNGDRNSVNVVYAEISPFNERIKVLCYPENRTFKQLTGTNRALLNVDESVITIIDIKRWQVDFALDFNITYPSEKPRNVSFKASGDLALPDHLDTGKIYHVENDLEWSQDDLIVHTTDGKRIVNNDYVAGGKTIHFTNSRIVYENSDIQPSPRTAQVNISDNRGKRITTYIPPGTSIRASWFTIYDTAQMQFEFKIVGISDLNLVSYASFMFQVRTDVDPPDTVSDLVVYPDEYGDNESYIDNDRAVHVGWGSSEDGSSGIGGYIIEASGEDFNYQKTVPASVTQYHLGLEPGYELPEGAVNISVSAVDAVGNEGDPAWTEVNIDLTGPTFTILDPTSGSWAIGSSPDIKVSVRDDLSVINGPSLLYRFSRDNGTTWVEWRSCNVYSNNLPQVEFIIRPHLVEGVDNLIQFRGEDMIGSGSTLSEIFRINVDGSRPTIRTEYPMIGVNHTTMKWLPREDPPLKILIDDGSGSGLDTGSVTYSMSTDDGGNYSVAIPTRMLLDNSEPGFDIHSFTPNIRWPEGDRNLLRITAVDNAGRISQSILRIRIDTTPSVNLIHPEYLGSYPGNISMAFLVDASDYDEDHLDISWTSDIDGGIGTGAALDRFLSPGDHIITLIVSDGVHEVRRIIPIKVVDVLNEDINSIDTDGDGMSDGFELRYGFDINSPDSLLDPDGDNFTNYQEFLGGTNPLSGSSYPGSSISEESLNVIPIIIFSISFILLMSTTFIMILESRKEPPVNLNFPQIR